MVTELIHGKLSQEIIGAAMAVLNELKPGLDEKIYENALVIELRARGRQVEQQKRFPVFYRGQHLGTMVQARCEVAKPTDRSEEETTDSPARHNRNALGISNSELNPIGENKMNIPPV